jgi:hypothetical protein
MYTFIKEIIMSISRFYSRFLPALVLILILSAATFAFAAANTVPESGAGDGTGTISGYTVSNVKYNLNATTPSNVDSVQFTLVATAGAGTPTSVHVQMNGAGSWFSCTNTSGTTWSCNLTGITALNATNLRVVAAQ